MATPLCNGKGWGGKQRYVDLKKKRKEELETPIAANPHRHADSDVNSALYQARDQSLIDHRKKSV